MTTTTNEAATQARVAATVKHPKRRIRKLEKRLSTVRAVEAKRTRQAEKARARNGATGLVAKRARQLEKASRRSAALEAIIVELRATTPTATARPKARTAAKATSSGPTVLRAFCLRERRTVEMKDPKPMVMSNGRAATVGTCSSCGVRVIRPG